MRILAIEPYYGSSHRAFLDSVVRRSRHEWTLVTGSPRHWKWRMRSAPLALADQAKQLEQAILRNGKGGFDMLFCTDMLDLPQWMGFMSGMPITAPEVPKVVYFHENQWTYPTAPKAREDFHYGYSNLMTAIAADEVWFNSQHHLEAFINASQSFLNRMPDSVAVHDLDRVRRRSTVIHAGFEPVKDSAWRMQSEELSPKDSLSLDASDRPISIGWVSRWENDKRPDQFLELLDQLKHDQVPFELVLLGARTRQEHPALQLIRDRHEASIRHDGFANEDYADWLAQMDVVVSTADHEFFGIAACEAIWAGAIPMFPNRLSYPELAGPESLYESLQDAADRIKFIAGQSTQARQERSNAARQRIADYRMTNIVPKIDARIDQLVR